MKRIFPSLLFVVLLVCSIISFSQNLASNNASATTISYSHRGSDSMPALPNYSSVSLITTAGGTDFDLGQAIATDANGNIYITGFFNGKANFGGISKITAGIDDIVIAKYDSNGIIQWVQTAGGIDADSGLGIAVDANGNVYVTGYFAGTVKFGDITKTSAGDDDMFVAKYNTHGAMEWVQTAGGKNWDSGQSISIDVSGNVYITGGFSGKANFGEISKTSAGNSDIYIAKYNGSGVIQWVRTAGGLSTDNGQGIALDKSGNIYITGYFAGKASFESTNKTSAGDDDIFVAKYNTNGAMEWVQTARGKSTDRGQDIVVDKTGNVYITGFSYETANFGEVAKTSVKGNEIFIAKYNNSGVIQWVKTTGGTASDYRQGIALDKTGNVYITGIFIGTTNFGAISKTSAGEIDMFVAKYSTRGIMQWVKTAGGTDDDFGIGIAINAKGNVYITGYFIGTANFLNTSKTSTGTRDIFVAKIQ